MKILSIKLSDTSANKIARLAKSRRTTMSAVVREALDRGLESSEDPLASIRDLIGSTQGPSDLSTNRKHLDGYGKD